MKVTKLFLMAAVAALALATTGCTKDDDENTVAAQNTALAVAGTYDGTLAMSVQGQEMGSNDVQIVITAESANTVTVTLPEISFGHSPIPALAVSGVSISTSDAGSYRLAKDGFDLTVNNVNYVGGELTGTTDGGTLSMTYSVTPGAMPMSIECSFEGTKNAE
ncbi:MAG: hypothetical protein AUK63_1310 [bacterium P3]|nr:MAG: hypothetical protein AUK63_1310 [bacterium P3]KWW40418.1 MAG: hypothetical protein F083_1655 [bacterium F083]